MKKSGKMPAKVRWKKVTAVGVERCETMKGNNENKRYSENKDSDFLGTLPSFNTSLSLDVTLCLQQDAIIMLLLTFYVDVIDMEEVHHFDSVHNAVYFAVTVLSQQIGSVSMTTNGIQLHFFFTIIINFCFRHFNYNYNYRTGFFLQISYNYTISASVEITIV